MAIFTKLMRIIGLPAMAGALTACSAVKVGYSALPELAFWRLDAYLDFDDTQAAQVRERLASAFDGQAALALVPVSQGTHFRITLPLAS